jgi:hypothetical protein
MPSCRSSLATWITRSSSHDEFPEACIDAQGVDRAAIHHTAGAAAINFFDTNLKGGKGN